MISVTAHVSKEIKVHTGYTRLPRDRGGRIECMVRRITNAEHVKEKMVRAIVGTSGIIGRAKALGA